MRWETLICDDIWSGKHINEFCGKKVIFCNFFWRNEYCHHQSSNSTDKISHNSQHGTTYGQSDACQLIKHTGRSSKFQIHQISILQVNSEFWSTVFLPKMKKFKLKKATCGNFFYIWKIISMGKILHQNSEFQLWNSKYNKKNCETLIGKTAGRPIDRPTDRPTRRKRSEHCITLGMRTNQNPCFDLIISEINKTYQDHTKHLIPLFKIRYIST